MQKTILLLILMLSLEARAAKFFYKDNFLTYYTTHNFSKVNTKVKRLVVVVHGALRNGDVYFKDTVLAAKKHGVEKTTMIVAPHFRRESDKREEGEIYYGNRWNTKWKYGYRSQDSDKVSSFKLMDTLVSEIANSGKFPYLKDIVITGHSAGGQFTQRYAVGSVLSTKISQNLSFIPSNPSSYMYLDEKRFSFKKGNFVERTTFQNCPEFNEYIYGPIKRASYLKKYTVSELKKIFRQNKVTYLMSEEDKGTDSLDRSCEAKAQGKNRIERAINFWHYDKKIIGTSNHRFLSIASIGHEHVDVYESEEAAIAVFGREEKSHPSFLYKKVGDARDIKIKPETLYLLLGGGKNEFKGFSSFLKAANLGDVLVLSAKPELNQRYTHDLWNMSLESENLVNSIETISFLSRSAGEQSFVIEKIKKAEAIFFTGGNQARYINRIKGTAAHRMLLKKIRAGIPVAGTSAGLAVMGEYIFSAKKGGLSSSYALRKPHAKEITIENNFLEIESLKGVITDTHFENRNREGRLLSFMFRTQFDFDLKAIFGIGIDEKSSLLLSNDKMQAVGGVHIYNTQTLYVPDRQTGSLTYRPILKETLKENKTYPHFSQLDFSMAIEVIDGEIK